MLQSQLTVCTFAFGQGPASGGYQNKMTRSEVPSKVDVSADHILTCVHSTSLYDSEKRCHVA